MKQLLEEYRENPEARDIVRIVSYTNDSVFLTGKAGTGKSTLLRRLIQNTYKNYIVLAPTGIAALNVEGQTIHSFFQFEPRPYLPHDRDITELAKKGDLLKKLDLIVIDEISMVRSDLMNAIDLSLRQNLRNNLPFGGKQLLLIGDLFQLPPVVDSKKVEEVEILNSNYSTPYFFSAKVLEAGFRFHIIELEKVYRQTDQQFINMLNSVRENTVQQHHLTWLNQRYSATYEPNGKDFEIILATTNAIVKETNQNKLRRIDTTEYSFDAIVTGNFKYERTESKLPADKVLSLKKDAQVMFIKNDPERRWVNGTIGQVISIDKNSLQIRANNGTTHTVQRVTWENYEYVWDKEEGRIVKNVVGTFTQYPVKLAWAVTIHKSQGQTFDKVVINLGTGAFTTGQTYVALSRCRSFNGITLKTRVRGSDIQVDNRIKTFLNSKDKNTMDRQKFESMVEGLQETINRLEPVNIELRQRIKLLEQKEAQHAQQVAALNNQIASKEQAITSLTAAKQKLQKELEELKQATGNYKLYIIGLAALSIFLAYRLIIA